MVRLSVASLVLLPVVVQVWRKVKKRDFLLMFVIGLTGNGLPGFLFPAAETVIDSAVAGVLNAMSPLFILLLAWLMFRKTFPFRNVIGILVGFGGAITLMVAGKEGVDFTQNVQYSLLIVAATISYSIAANVTKGFFNEYNPVWLTAFALASVGYPAVVYLAFDGEFWTTLAEHPHGMASLGYIAIIGAVGTALAVILFNRMLQIGNIIFASSVTYTIPLVAVMWGVLFFDESMGWQHFLGFGIILCGVYLVNRK
ncbi:MAG: DMT family transporter, partial [Bacteroidota bacterium]